MIVFVQIVQVPGMPVIVLVIRAAMGQGRILVMDMLMTVVVLVGVGVYLLPMPVFVMVPVGMAVTVQVAVLVSVMIHRASLGAAPILAVRGTRSVVVPPGVRALAPRLSARLFASPAPSPITACVQRAGACRIRFWRKDALYVNIRAGARASIRPGARRQTPMWIVPDEDSVLPLPAQLQPA